jgi:hypothetical protein
MELEEIPTTGQPTNFLEVTIENGTITTHMTEDGIRLFRHLKQKGINFDVKIEHCG